MLQIKLRMLEACNHAGRYNFVSNHFVSEPRRDPNDLKVFKFLKPQLVKATPRRAATTSLQLPDSSSAYIHINPSDLIQQSKINELNGKKLKILKYQKDSKPTYI